MLLDFMLHLNILLNGVKCLEKKTKHSMQMLNIDKEKRNRMLKV